MALVLLVAVLSVAVPICGAYFVEKVAVPRLAERYGVDLRLAAAHIRPNRVLLRGLIVRIPGRADPLTCPRAEVHFRPLALLRGQLELTEVVIDRPLIQLIRGGDEDNVTELLNRIRTPSPTPSEPGRRRRMSGPQTVVLQSAELDIRDELGTLHIGGVDATVARTGPSQLSLHDSNAEVAGGASARAGRVIIRWSSAGRFLPLGLPEIEVFGAAIVPWRRLAMTGINGTIRPDAAEPTRAVIALAGGYGGVDRELWQARGWVRPDGNGTLRSQRGAEAELSILAQRFRLSSLEPILKDTPIIDADQTEVDASLDLKFAQRALDFSGSFHMAGLSIYTPRLVAEPVRDLGFDVTARGRIDLKTRRFRLEKAAVTWNGATAEIDGEAEAQPAGLGLAAAAPTTPTLAPTPAPTPAPAAGPGGPAGAAPSRGWRERWRSVSLHLAVPPIACQALLDSLPDGIVSRIRDFKLGGTFSTDVRLFVDFAKLMKLPPARDPNALEEEEGAEALPPPPPPPPPKAKPARGANGAAVVAAKEPKDEPVQLSGKVGIDGCKVLEAPKEMLASRLLAPFEHSVLIEGDRELRFVIGEENPDFVTYDQISPHLINSIMTTEDNGFLRHRGFILPEFRSALQSNLERGYFRLGASSITMQMVKNVLLSKEKTLSRKLQELFLTWYLETYLTDDTDMLKAVGKGMSPNQFWLTKLQKNAAAAKEAAAAAAAAGQLTAPEPTVPVAPAAPVTAAQAYSPLRDINPIKRRILEIYFNAIEFGPYLYGIGKAARHYFGKPAKDLTPREAAWFSSILPNPKRRYIHFCKGAPDEKWEKYIDRIVRRNHERGRLTDEEFATAMQDRLVFDRAEALPEKDCVALITRLTDQALQAALAAAAQGTGGGGPAPSPLPTPPPARLPAPPPWAEDEVHTRSKKTQ